MMGSCEERVPLRMQVARLQGPITCEMQFSGGAEWTSIRLRLEPLFDQSGYAVDVVDATGP